MNTWQPLSVRRGLKPAETLVEGVPDHLYPSLERWLDDYCNPYGRSPASTIENRLLGLAVAARISLSRGTVPQMFRDFHAECEDPDLMLDVLDAALATGKSGWEPLNTILEQGGSAWTVREDGRGLERRVDDTTIEAFKSATTATDAASDDLKTAWGHAYGRNPDASDAWDHAIKAVEHVLAPIVTPNNSKATLGSIIAAIEQAPTKVTFVLQSSSKDLTNIETLTAMLRLIWPNPDRHGGVAGSGRKPDLGEAQSVLHTAITIVQFVHNSTLT